MLDTNLLAILACPICKNSITQVEEGVEHALYCSACSRYYPIYKWIPILLKKEARTRTQWEVFLKKEALATYKEDR